MDLLIVLIVLLVLFGGGGGIYWGMGAGWGVGPVGLIVAVLVVAYLLNGYRGRRGPPGAADLRARRRRPGRFRAAGRSRLFTRAARIFLEAAPVS